MQVLSPNANDNIDLSEGQSSVVSDQERGGNLSTFTPLDSPQMETAVHLFIEEEPRPSTSKDYGVKDPLAFHERCKITLPSPSTEKIRKSTRTRHTPISLADDYFITSSEANKRMRSSNVVSTNTV